MGPKQSKTSWALFPNSMTINIFPLIRSKSYHTMNLLTLESHLMNNEFVLIFNCIWCTTTHRSYAIICRSITTCLLGLAYLQRGLCNSDFWVCLIICTDWCLGKTNSIFALWVDWNERNVGFCTRSTRNFSRVHKRMVLQECR